MHTKKPKPPYDFKKKKKNNQDKTEGTFCNLLKGHLYKVYN